MGVVMGITAGLLGFAAALAGLMLWTALVFPRPTERARATLEEWPGRCFGTGLLLALLLGGPAVALRSSPNGLAKLAGLALALALGVWLAFGMAGMAVLLGERLRPLSPAMTPLGGLVRGAVTLELAALLPFFGWFLVTPLAGLVLIGAGARATWRHPPRRSIPCARSDGSDG
jgi:hypothetical protein